LCDPADLTRQTVDCMSLVVCVLPADATQYYITTSLNSTCVVLYMAFLGYLARFGHLLHTPSTLPNQPFQMEGGTWPQKDIDMLKYIAPAYCGAQFILYLNMTAFTARNVTGTDAKVLGQWPPNWTSGCLIFLFFIQF